MDAPVPTTPPKPIDLMELRERILAVKSGALPPNAVDPNELRQALSQMREARTQRATNPSPRAAKAGTTAPIQLAGGKPGGLLDLMSKD